MKNRVGEGLLILTLVLIGVVCRVYFRGIPNFMPVAGMALFAGYYFRNSWQAGLVPLGIMAVSDCFLSGYAWQMRFVVYASLLLPIFLGRFLQPLGSRASASVAATWGLAGGLLGCSLASSILFFLMTNFAWWPWSNMYEHNWQGLWECYLAGIPFFRYTLAADLFFSFVLFGGHALAVTLARLPELNSARIEEQAR